IESHLSSNNIHANSLKELVKFSRGDHHVSAEKAMELGALALVSNGQRVLKSVASLNSIVPQNLRHMLTDEQWSTVSLKLREFISSYALR
ncbi:hypothetical protein P879_04317, partial [Paragonimus westermani]